MVQAEARELSQPGRSAPMRQAFRGMRAAVTLLTRVPVGGFPYTDAEWRWSTAHLPLIGALVGATSVAAFITVARAGSFVAAVVAVLTSTVVTGGLHEDGLADSADALGGGTSRERVLAILKDSRIGAFGACALVLSLVLRIALIARLAPQVSAPLVIVGAWSRLSPVALIAALPYVTEPSVAKSRAVAAARWPQLVVALGWALAAAAGARALGAVSYVELAAPLLSGVLATIVCGAYFRARVGGITGDFLGASQQASECVMLLALAVVRGGGM